MVALNFQARFAEAVETGRKPHTIRARRKDGRDPRPGDALQLYTGMRTKACRKLLETVCTRVAPITVANTYVATVPGCTWPGCTWDGLNLEAFAKDEGFANWDEMRGWFENTHGLPFTGLLICWVPPKVECPACDGTGQCPMCEPDDTGCPACDDDKACQKCMGFGELTPADAAGWML